MIATAPVPVPNQRDELIRVAERAAIHEQKVTDLEGPPVSRPEQDRQFAVTPYPVSGDAVRDAQCLEAGDHSRQTFALPADRGLRVDDYAQCSVTQ